MGRISIASLALLAFALATIAGCPLADGGDGDANGTTPTTIAGTWSGTLSCTSTETVGDLIGNPRPGSRDLTITFNSQYIPTGLPIWGFSRAFDQTATISSVGQSETFNFEANFPYRDITLVATITEATYSESGATIVIELQYSATSGNLTQEGTGTMTIQATVDGDSLTFSGVAEYAVTQTAGDISLETTETIACTGTLTKQ